MNEKGLEVFLNFCRFQLRERKIRNERNTKPMSHSNTTFHQLLTPELKNTFAKIVRKYQGDKKVRTLTCWNQLLVMLFVQFTGRASLRETAAGFNAGIKKLYHLGAAPVVYNTLAHANKTRSWEMFRDLAQELYGLCCEKRGKRSEFRFKSKLFIMDATVISLCLTLYPWAKFRTKKGAVKMHTLLDQHDALPTFIVMSDGKTHETAAAWNLPVPTGSIVVLDRAYLDYALLYHYQQKGLFFVTRLKSNSKWRRLGSREANKNKGVICDQDIALSGKLAHKYPETLRRVKFKAADGNVYEFLTNRFDLAATTIADIYKARWDIELFFKWIKQNLKIKSFLGTSQNAVFAQIWIAICAYLMISYLKLSSKSKMALARILSLIQLYIFSPHHLSDLLDEKWKSLPFIPSSCQLVLEGF